ncbi:surface carbohydrate biosynthesis protein [Pontibacter sp. HSC-36F09]|uniref:surface carbohydrate biosynthesis protein n=1 Tax=Pontibacter sp. HSC-36F09 TaxID=2910966 RepID=UPI00209D3731|nr:surface carbohydrate biosynthesis protein [Pontibacter sp. HSC-36F09]MCP2043678.1 surface carbohydrate biosynthesis protein [Pontibacter sp. HSC-36F09]
MNILLPIETINREIDFKIVLASILASNDHNIFIGQHDFLMSLLPKMKGGVYIGKNLFSRRSDLEKGKKYSELKKKGFDIIYLHEEGAVYAGDEQNWEQVLKQQYDLRFFDEQDRICVWGDLQKRIDIQRSNGLNIFVTGHPRFDLYKKEWNSYFSNDVEKIKTEYNSYILVNGNYGVANHGLGVSYVFSDAFSYKVDDIDARLKRVGFFSYSTKQLVSIIELTHQLAVRYPNKKIIYRPHPSESYKYYEAVFGGISNIIVNHVGPVGPWILGAEAVIHDGCTTAIEASLANIPVINYKPHTSNEHDIWLPNQLGKQATSFNEVCNLLDNVLQFDFSFSKIESVEKVYDLFYNFEGDSFERFINIVESKINEKKDKSESPSSSFINKNYLIQKAKTSLASVISKESGRKINYHRNKFYGFDKEVVSSKFKQAGKVLGKQIDYKLHNPFLIEIR